MLRFFYSTLLIYIGKQCRLFVYVLNYNLVEEHTALNKRKNDKRESEKRKLVFSEYENQSDDRFQK